MPMVGSSSHNAHTVSALATLIPIPTEFSWVGASGGTSFHTVMAPASRIQVRFLWAPDSDDTVLFDLVIQMSALNVPMTGAFTPNIDQYILYRDSALGGIVSFETDILLIHSPILQFRVGPLQASNTGHVIMTSTISMASI